MTELQLRTELLFTEWWQIKKLIYIKYELLKLSKINGKKFI